ncbi:hypothetical protein [Aristophania vespae]|uniref:hypothetical protein n=1 Tax=Aristophania vespae TaxID=2697033 RepID=UPI00235178FF|nr:hypothetical protein [Aristophania vespae]UMM63109.1 hypothetical protein DM15PD_00630 [Aristophania vespae]
MTGSTSPTLERTFKPDYEKIGKKRRRSDTLGALRNSIGDDVIADAQLWIKRWELGENGYCDAHKNLFSPTIPGNELTFIAFRARAWKHIRDFQKYAGQDRHRLLVQLLGYGWSFISIGRSRWPNTSENWARSKASDLCAETLIMLHKFWTEQRKKERQNIIEITKLHRSGHSIPLLCQTYHLAATGIRHRIQQGEKILNRPKHGLTATGG